MGMYTELIFGASLKTDTPKEVIDTIKYMINEIQDLPENYPFDEDGRHSFMLQGGSYYFGVNQGVYEFRYDKIGKNWILSTRSNIKNYNSEIETFLEWIKPYIENGSGRRNMYAVVMYEEADEPTIYYLGEED